jgi:UPF0176 protein
VSFCTGGIRCEKAAPFLLSQGFKNTYQLEGGILKYFMDNKPEEVNKHWKGECFVFDSRVGVMPDLSESGSVICYRCRNPLNHEDQKHEKYIKEKYCQFCCDSYEKEQDDIKKNYLDKMQKMKERKEENKKKYLEDYQNRLNSKLVE